MYTTTHTPQTAHRQSHTPQFRYASAFNQDISGWNTGSVTYMGNTFNGASAFNADISGWDTSSVTNMMSMFQDASAFNADISGWDTSSVTTMENMFNGASAFDAYLPDWDTSSVTEAANMFNGASAWLALHERVDGTASFDGPPSAWLDTRPSCTSCEEKLDKLGLVTERALNVDCVVH